MKFGPQYVHEDWRPDVPHPEIPRCVVCTKFHATHSALLHTLRTRRLLTHCFIEIVCPIHHGRNGEHLAARHGDVLSGVHGVGLAGLGEMLN